MTNKSGAPKDGQLVLKESYDVSSNAIRMLQANNLVPESFDEIDLSYTGDNLTSVVYKKDNITIKTLTLTYSGSNLTNVTAS